MNRWFAYFEELIDPLEDKPVQQPPAGTRAFFRHYLWPIRWLLLITVVISSIASIAELMLYVYLGRLVDWMNSTEPSAFYTEHGPALMVMAFVLVVVRPVSLFITRCLITLTLTPGLSNTVRWRNHRYVVRQSLHYFQSDFAGRIAQKVIQTGNSYRETVINVLDGVWLLFIYLAGIVYLFLDIDWRLLMPIAVWSAGYCAVVVKLMPPVGSLSRAVSEANSALTGRIVDSYTNIQAVKLFAHAEREEEFVSEGFKRHTVAFRALLRAILRMLLSLVVINTLLILSTAYLSIYYWQQGSISVGSIAIANGLILRLNQMSGWILRTISSLFESIGTVQNGIETISVKNSVVDKKNATEMVVNHASVDFQSVQFHYSEDENDQSMGITDVHSVKTDDAAVGVGAPASVIEDFSFHVKAGEKIGVVGRSGAGKSTLVNLLLRFYDLDSGKILIDGQDISTVTQGSLRTSIAMVSQDTSLLHRSIRDNIAYGRPQATDDEIIRAAEFAQADSFIPGLVDSDGRRGYDAHVGERGVKLSGGQRQRIAIARVILKDAPILILDEATSALDSEVEGVIQDKLRDLMHGKTVIAIAHRLSTIAAMDRLIVMEAGRILEAGTHDELIADGGLYAELWDLQSGGFLARH